MRQTLILVHGVPGTGKTTISRKLAADLHLPCIGKDDIKEVMFERMGTGDAKWSQDQGAAAAEMLFTLIAVLLSRKRSFIAESAYYAQLAVPRLREILAANDAQCIEIYCKTEREERQRRSLQRIADGLRHPGHLDDQLTMDESQVTERYGPLHVGTYVEADTTRFDDVSYSVLLQQVRGIIEAR